MTTSAPVFMGGFDVSQATCTINGIPCAEGVRDYYEGADRQSGPDLSKTYYCAWADRFKVANACLGLSTAVTKGGAITFLPPLQHPEILTCYCSSLRISGCGKPFQGTYQLAFPVAKITIGFKAYPWSFQGFNEDPQGLQNIDAATSFVYARQEIDQGEETLEVPASALLMNGAAPARGMSVAFAHVVMRITFERMPFLPVNTIQIYNNVNDSTFLGCARGHVKFLGSQTRRSAQSDGSATQSLTNTYAYRPIADWNYFPNPYARSCPNSVARRGS